MRGTRKFLLAAVCLASLALTHAQETTLVAAPPAPPGQADQGAVSARLHAAKNVVALRPPLGSVPQSVFDAKPRLSPDAGKRSALVAAVAPPVAGCYDIDIGPVYSAPTAPAGSIDCFEFVAPDATKIVSYVADLPAGEQHDLHLVQVNDDGSLVYLDSQTGTDASKIVEAIPGPVRLLLLVDSETGVGGSTFLFQVTGTTGYDAYEPNDSPAHPSALTGDQVVSANLDTAADVDYYTVTVPSTQAATTVTFNGTGTQVAQLLVSGGWASLASGTTYRVTGGPALALRVYDTNASAPAGQAYTLRLSDGNGQAGFYQFLDTENISHLVSGAENVARIVNAGVIAWDSTGNVRLPPGEHVTVRVYDNGTTLVTTASGYTDASGQVLIPLNIGECQGSGAQTGDFQTLSNPADHWRITYMPAVAQATLDFQTNVPNSGNEVFWHICTETYLGRY